MDNPNTTFTERSDNIEPFLRKLEEVYTEFQGRIPDYFDFAFATLIRGVAFGAGPDLGGALAPLGRMLEDLHSQQQFMEQLVPEGATPN